MTVIEQQRHTIVIQGKQNDDQDWVDFGESEKVTDKNVLFQAYQLASNLKDQFDQTRVVNRTYFYTFQDKEIQK